jgi:hypothetical protein
MHPAACHQGHCEQTLTKKETSRHLTCFGAVPAGNKIPDMDGVLCQFSLSLMSLTLNVAQALAT